MPASAPGPASALLHTVNIGGWQTNHGSIVDCLTSQSLCCFQETLLSEPSLASARANLRKQGFSFLRTPPAPKKFCRDGNGGSIEQADQELVSSTLVTLLSLPWHATLPVASACTIQVVSLLALVDAPGGARWILATFYAPSGHDMQSERSAFLQ